MINDSESYFQGVSEFSEYSKPITDSADVVVIGSGPAGAIVAKEVAESGKSVILLEEGPVYREKDFVPFDGAASLVKTARECGLRTTIGNVFMPTIQAVLLGGGSVINSAICVRPPAWVFDDWAEKYNLPTLTLEKLRPHFERVEKFLNIHPTEEKILGRRNLLFKQGCDALGISSEPASRNEIGCRGSGECFTGCTIRAKQSMDISYIPAAIKAGARVYTSVRAEHILQSGKRVTAVTGHVIKPYSDKESYEVRIGAKTIVLAAGVTASPVIMIKSGIHSASGQIGKNLRFHPGIAVAGIFPDEVNPWEGATQAYHSLHFLKEGFKLEVLWAPPGLLAVRFPGFGYQYKEYISRYKYIAPWDAIAKGNASVGRIKVRRNSWNPILYYHLHQEDADILHRAMGVIADMFFAARAESILPGLNKVPPVVTRSMGSQVIRKAVIKPTDIITSGTHLFGTTRMGGDPQSSVVDDTGRVHGYDNLYIADTGIMPISTAVNPMLTCMALADMIGGHVSANT